jgi:predicted Zn-dependent peptidase
MIKYREHTLANGLRVIAHRAEHTEMAAVNVLYCVGARNENPARTGFAHLFEHLMFGGTRAVPDFDEWLHKACAENNAFTNNDYTDYYITLPRENVEVALWLEADRMTGLDITPRTLDNEKKVVIEEYNQRYLNQPYGDQGLLLRDMVYKEHPYRWPTIGLSPDHIRDATPADVKAFYGRYYNPANAILSVASEIESDEIFEMAEKWFSGIAGGERPVDKIPVEPTQTTARRLEVTRDVPATALTIAFPMGARTSRNYYACDILSDVLAGGNSARLYQSLVKDSRLLSSVNAYITGDVDPGMFVVTGQLLPEISVAVAEEAMWGELTRLAREPVGDYELEKVKNKFEAETTFGELNVMNKAMNMGFYAMLGDLPLINKEVAIYRSFSATELLSEARAMFTRERSSTLVYKAKAQ